MPQAEQRPRNVRATSGVASGATSAVVSAQHPVNHPGSWREASHQAPMNVRTKVGAVVRK